MSNIQVLLSVGAMILLSILIINVSRTSLYTEDVLYDSSFGILATSLGVSIIEDASKKHFDENTDSSAVSSTGELSTILGPDSGEDPNDPNTFDDFDDYNGYTRVDSSMPSAIFNVKCKVVYVEPANLDSFSVNATWNKKLTVKVWSISMKDTVVQSSIFSYWYFR